jgi:hypothetical protein
VSDGPHRSLPMRQGWRDLAERADRSAFEPDQVADAVPEALGDDWREERCDELVREIRSLLGDGRQGSLFAQEKQDAVAALSKLSGAGYQLRRLLLDAVGQAVESGLVGPQALLEGIATGLAVRCGAGVRQVEEHYLRKSTEHRAANVRERIESGAAMSDFYAIARRFLKLDGGSSSAAPEKKQQDGLDDGVRL